MRMRALLPRRIDAQIGCVLLLTLCLCASSWQGGLHAAATVAAVHGRVPAPPASSIENAAHAIALPIIVKQPPLPVFANGDFEAEQGGGWAEASSNGAALITDGAYLPDAVAPRSGTRAAWLGGLPDEVSSLTQSVAVPAFYDALTLRYWYWIASNETDCSDDVGAVRIEGVAVKTHELCRATQTNGWASACVVLSGYGGRAPTFQFVVELDGSKNSNLFIDDISLALSCEP